MLATILAAVAGAANAGGFFALGRYTSHMTGYVSQFADNMAIFEFGAAAISIVAIASFVGGAAFSTVLINGARRCSGKSQYSWPLAVQGVLLGCFAGGGYLRTETGHIILLAFLCFIMGMQNATITKISGARIRTTHLTGMITDIGIEFGRAVFGRLAPASNIHTDRRKLKILLRLVAAFLFGAIGGALGVSHVGFSFFLIPAAVLLFLGLPARGTSRIGSI